MDTSQHTLLLCARLWTFFSVLLISCAVVLIVGTGSATAQDVTPKMPSTPELTNAAMAPPPPTPQLLTFPAWQTIEPGLESVVSQALSSAGRRVEIRILRLDPHFFDFVVLTASAPEAKALSLAKWAKQHNLAAVINAGMFLQDKITHTGYLQAGTHLNNPRIVSRFGAFFMAGTRDPELPTVALLDRTETDCEALLPYYDMVVQNYRMISADRRLLWQPGGMEHAVAAVGRDGTGRILFVICQDDLTGADLGILLLDMPLDVRLVMYVEGGAQSGMALRLADGTTHVWMGKHLADLLTAGHNDLPLPNVIGARRKAVTQ